MNLFSEHARELSGMPPEWEAYSWKVVGDYDDRARQIYEIRGAVAPLMTRGSRKGYPNWERRDKATESTVYFSPVEHDEWVAEWERTTGKCARCTGTGEVFRSWSKDTGIVRRPCLECGGTGDAKRSEEK